MIVPDVNLLVYAYDRTAPAHRRARAWWESVLSGYEPVGLPWIAVLAFVRLTTHPTLNDNPMTVVQARECVESWLERGHVRLLSPEATTFLRFFELLAVGGVGGNLCTDALIAALAEEHGGKVYSNDADFGRFAGIAWENPLR
ncbi:ribonuclease VapC33 [mine drainage metagenome]|uniref:Ribonuclease VapC33 n=1 Tax=mine drainage metagenome TaxID=410659 RepID=A0A1J5TCH1_9ZZZZ